MCERRPTRSVRMTAVPQRDWDCGTVEDNRRCYTVGSFAFAVYSAASAKTAVVLSGSSSSTVLSMRSFSLTSSVSAASQSQAATIRALGQRRMAGPGMPRCLGHSSTQGLCLPPKRRTRRARCPSRALSTVRFAARSRPASGAGCERTGSGCHQALVG
jgi:hypothetical protein